MNPVKKRRKAVVEETDCVACGCCVKVCPMGTMTQLICKAKFSKV